ncbi:TetR/AcrR family transcriptional regulator [Aurantimonas sp. A3-2-R12]|uniref:TetR/AcrR family transcriptional regulator n=1 Tax=Aurantimonas sp. A3-2-R12 TaxID=3114362 RepID=UPI002E1975B9|nr:TetR/AcrR family transcriptional regulator [Aurantimonas sp. A3-2-R12]
MDLVVRQFWARGFEATSVRDLEAATGLGMTSLYNAFGGKRALFRTALEHYSESRTGECLRELERLSSPADRIRAFVARLIEAALGDPDRMGCLVINTAIELGPHDPEIAAIVARNLGEVEAFFRRNFEAAQRAGEADLSVAPADAARSFSTLMFGLRVLARTRPDRETMEGAVRPLLALLRTSDGSHPAGASTSKAEGDPH